MDASVFKNLFDELNNMFARLIFVCIIGGIAILAWVIYFIVVFCFPVNEQQVEIEKKKQAIIEKETYERLKKKFEVPSDHFKGI